MIDTKKTKDGRCLLGDRRMKCKRVDRPLVADRMHTVRCARCLKRG
jgi:hypothetical protein